MRLPPRLIAPVAFGAAALLALSTAWGLTQVVETRGISAVEAELARAGIDWVEVDADGLQVHLAGTAPNEAARFRALNAAGRAVQAARVQDGLEVRPTSAAAAPDFVVEMLRNDNEIQLIGLVPEIGPDAPPDVMDAEAIAAAAQVSPAARVADMLESAAYPAPATWDAAIRFGLSALAELPRAKVSVSAGRVAVTAIADTAEEQRRIEGDLNRSAPAGVNLVLAISAPRPVIAPFTLRFLIDGSGVRFDACSADTDEARDRIIAAANAAGLEGKAVCTLGLGSPSPRWAEAVTAGIAAVQALEGGSVTFSDGDVTLVAAEGTPQATFDRTVGALQRALPPAFSLDATLPLAAETQEGPVEFTAALSPEGRVELRGRLYDALQRDAVDAFARATFGAADVDSATRVDAGVPQGWPIRVMAGIEALSLIAHGSVTVTPDAVTLSGVTGSQSAQARITQLLSGKLGQGQTFTVNVRYDEELDPLAALPTPEECLADMDAVVARQKITFTPGSAEIAAAAQSALGALADVLTDCPDLPVEIGGHTDSQGSEGGNQALSQARAEAVLIALQGRGVDTGAMTAKGYGEAQPIADNATDTGREANRRIEFTLPGRPVTQAAAAPAVFDPAAPSVAPTEMTQRPERRPERPAERLPQDD
jgi:OOP family OmpA-OmpF porin